MMLWIAFVGFGNPKRVLFNSNGTFIGRFHLDAAGNDIPFRNAATTIIDGNGDVKEVKVKLNKQ